MAKFPWQKKSQQAPAPQPPEQQSPEKVPEQRNTIEMYRSEEDAKGGPIVAEVHPSEVENWKAAGWKTK